MRHAFTLVGVKEAVVGRTALDGIELPHQVGHIAHSGAEALPKQRRGLVGGVPGQEDVPGAPLLRDAPPERIYRQPVRSELVCRQHAVADPFHARGSGNFLGVVPRHQHELHPHPFAGEADPQGGPCVMTQEDHVGRQAGAFFQNAVRDKPLCILAQLFALDAQRLAAW